MTRRDDERLRDALLEIEHAAPVYLPPRVRPRADRRLVWALGGVSALTVVLLAVLLANTLPDDREIGEASPTVGPSSTPADAPTPSPAAGSPLPTERPSATAAPPQTPTPTPGPITRWAPVAEFATDGFAEEVQSVTYAAGQFIAVGYREPLDQRTAVAPPQDVPLIWRSVDGRNWERVTAGDPFANAHLTSVVPLPDGSAGIFGWVDAGGGLSPETFSAWRSTDGVAWSPIALNLPNEVLPGPVVAGPRGFLTAASGPDDDAWYEQLWHSDDGITWRSVRAFQHAEVGIRETVQTYDAGAEGFVVTAQRYEASEEAAFENPVAFVLASAGGTSWFEADADVTPRATDLVVAPLAGDWMILTRDWESTSVTAWFSASGLGWEQRGSLEVPIPEAQTDQALGGIAGSFTSTGDRFILTGLAVYCCHGPGWASGVWSSFDGRSWERLGFPADTIVRDAVTHDDVTVLVGHGGASPEADWKAVATFWIGERD